MSTAHSSLPTSLSVLYRLAQTVLTAQDEREVLKLVVDAPITVMGAHTACVLPVLSDGQIGGFVAAGPGAAQVQQLDRPEFEAGLSGWVLRERQMAVSPAGSDDPRESELVREHRRQNGCGHIVVLPLQHQETVLGTLTIITAADTEAFGQDELEWFEALANLATVSMLQHRLNAQVAHLKHFDALTVLPTRALFEDRLQQALARTADQQKPCAVLYIGLDGFRGIDQQFGQDTADRVLRTTATRLRAAVRGTDTVARLDNKRFVVMLNDLRDPDDALLVAEKLRLMICVPMSLPASVVTLGASIGVSVSPDHGDDPATLCQLADDAMRSARAQGRNLVRLAELPVNVSS